MKNRNLVLLTMGFEIAALNYFVSVYQSAAWLCVGFACLSLANLVDFKKMAVSAIIVLLANGLLITICNQILDNEAMELLLKVMIGQSIIETALLSHLLTSKGDSKIYFKYSAFLFILVLFGICIAPHFLIEDKMFYLCFDLISFVPMMIIGMT